METGWLHDTAEFINRVGFPVTIACILALGIWNVIRWFKPWGEKLVQSHIEFTTSLSETQKKQAVASTDTVRVLEELQILHKGGRKAIGHLADATLAAAPENRRSDVQHHVQQVHSALDTHT